MCLWWWARTTRPASLCRWTATTVLTTPVMPAAWTHLYNSGEGELCVHVGDGDAAGNGGSGDGVVEDITASIS